MFVSSIAWDVGACAHGKFSIAMDRAVLKGMAIRGVDGHRVLCDMIAARESVLSSSWPNAGRKARRSNTAGSLTAHWECDDARHS